MSKITIIGCGKTGRGFLARLLNGNDIIFIDKNKNLVDNLNKTKKIKITYFGNKHKDCEVTGFKAFTWEQITKIEADLIFVSVGGANLKDVGENLKNRITCPQKIIVCENIYHPEKILADTINLPQVEIAESTVFCTTIEDGIINIKSEWYPYLQYNADRFKDNSFNYEGIKPIRNFGNFLTRKLFTYNSASSIIAYLGNIKGYTIYSDAANDREILELLDKNYKEINDCMCKEFGYSIEDQKEFALLSRNKFTDRTIVDTIARNAREPQRKITKNERIVGPMLLLDKYGKDSSVLEKTLAAALCYTAPDEKTWNDIVKEKGKAGVLTELCGLDKNSKHFNKILSLAETGMIFN